MLEVPPPSFVTVHGRRLAYDEMSPSHPRGTVLLLTGLASKRLGWYKQLPVFGQVYRTIARGRRHLSVYARGAFRAGLLLGLLLPVVLVVAGSL